MDVKLVIFAGLVLAAIILAVEAGKHKKVVIHVPYKVKKIKHTHTIYKTIHHHHAAHGKGHGKAHEQDEEEEHEHFHHYGDTHGHGSMLQPVHSLPIHSTPTEMRQHGRGPYEHHR